MAPEKPKLGARKRERPVVGARQNYTVNRRVPATAIARSRDAHLRVDPGLDTPLPAP
jgi:hypothetical protein